MRAGRATTRATSCRCCTSPASSRARASCPVHVRVVLEGEEEVGGSNVLRYLAQDERGADCAIVFDGGMIDESRPALDIAVRGVVMARVRVRTAERDLHSGRLRRRGNERRARAHADARPRPPRPGRPGARRAARRAAAAEPPRRSRSWAELPRGSRRPRRRPARTRSRRAPPPSSTRAPGRTRASTSTASRAATRVQRRTIIPCTASARLTVRIALGQDGERDRRGARAHPARGGAARRRDRARGRARRARRLRRGRSGARAGARRDRPRRRQPPAVRAHRRLDPDPRRAGPARHPDGAVRASRSTPTASTARTRATAWRASRSASAPRASSTPRSRPSR